jgi:catechol 2,3-dioxygenase
MTQAAQNTGISWLRSVEFDVTSLAKSMEFYIERWGLTEVARTADAVYLRGTGTEHHIVVLREGPVSGIRSMNFGAADRAAIDALHAELGANAVGPPAELREPGGGYGFTFRDPEGRQTRVIADIATHAEAGTRADAPIKLSHVVHSSIDAPAAAAFFARLGFRLRDETGRIFFMGCNAEHHCLAFARGKFTMLSHVAFDLPSIDGLMRGAGRLKAAGLPLEWGVGRHGPGDNVFAYFMDPDELVVEYTTEMEHVDDRSYVRHGPDYWDKRESSDAWGVASPPSERFRSRASRQPAQVR